MSRLLPTLTAGLRGITASLRSSEPPLLPALIVFALFLSSGIPVALASPAPGTPEAVEHQEPEHAAEEDDHGAADEHAEDGEHGAEEHHGPTWTEVVQRWINFVLLLGLLWWLLVVPPAFVVENFEFPGLKVVLASRGQDIVRSRDLAQEQAAEAENRLQESAQRLENVEKEVAGLVSEAEADAGEERERIIAAAGAEADRIREGAQRDLGAEVIRARRDLKRHVADLTVGMAAEMLRENLSSEDQNRLVRQYLDRLGETVS